MESGFEKAQADHNVFNHRVNFWLGIAIGIACLRSMK